MLSQELSCIWTSCASLAPYEQAMRQWASFILWPLTHGWTNTEALMTLLFHSL